MSSNGPKRANAPYPISYSNSFPLINPLRHRGDIGSFLSIFLNLQSDLAKGRVLRDKHKLEVLNVTADSAYNHKYNKILHFRISLR